MFVFSHWSGALTASVTRFLLTENARILKFLRKIITQVLLKNLLLKQTILINLQSCESPLVC